MVLTSIELINASKRIVWCFLDESTVIRIALVVSPSGPCLLAYGLADRPLRSRRLDRNRTAENVHWTISGRSSGRPF